MTGPSEEVEVSGRPIRVVHPTDEVRVVFGAGDEYRYLATGEDTDGEYFLVEAIVPPGGGPPTHIQTRVLLYALLKHFERLDLFPKNYLDPKSQAESALAYWLMHMLSFVTGNLDRRGGNVRSVGFYNNSKAGRGNYEKGFAEG